MNQERIFELAKQADLIQWDSLPSGARTPDHESVVKAQKFAQLIVRECMEQINKVEEKGDAHLGGGYFYDGTRLCRDAIKQHFGVEE